MSDEYTRELWSKYQEGQQEEDRREWLRARLRAVEIEPTAWIRLCQSSRIQILQPEEEIQEFDLREIFSEAPSQPSLYRFHIAASMRQFCVYNGDMGSMIYAIHPDGSRTTVNIDHLPLGVCNCVQSLVYLPERDEVGVQILETLSNAEQMRLGINRDLNRVYDMSGTKLYEDTRLIFARLRDGWLVHGDMWNISVSDCGEPEIRLHWGNAVLLEDESALVSMVELPEGSRAKDRIPLLESRYHLGRQSYADNRVHARLVEAPVSVVNGVVKYAQDQLRN